MTYEILDPRNLEDLGEVLHDTAAAAPGDEASLVLARTPSGTMALAGYEGEGIGRLTHYFATSLGDRAQILALGRAIVEALDPAPDPPQHFAPWGAAATSCGAAVPRGLAGTTDRRDETTCDDCSARFTKPEPELATVELISDPTLPLDVEIRTIALDAAVRAIGDTGDDVVTHARAIERFLVGEAEEQEEEETDTRPVTVGDYVQGFGPNIGGDEVQGTVTAVRVVGGGGASRYRIAGPSHREGGIWHAAAVRVPRPETQR